MALTTTQRTIGKYQVMAKLAESPTGKVYKGFDPSTKTTVAIKVATTAVVRDEVMLRRFEHEFRSMSILRHPNIVRGLDFGWEGPKPYIVLEYIDGEDLWSRIERLGRIPEPEAVALITQVAEGLHEAHKHGIIHRNMKPDNILITGDGRAKVTDMGLSKDLEEDADLTRPCHGLGTPNFIAPEQFGDAKNATIRCDIYSLGTTLYMALTGQVPFAGANLTTIMKLKLANEMMSPRKLVPTVSEPVEWAVRRAVQADPNRRYASCPEFIAALTTDPTGLAADTDAKRRITSRRAGNEAQRSGRDRRAAMRFDCSLPTACVINDSLHDEEAECQTSWDAQVCNLSVTGIGLLVPRRFEPGSVLTVVLSSRVGNWKESRQMRVVRVMPANGKTWFLAGPLTNKLSKEELRKLL
jgi:serine/threonine protein kinase